MRHPDIQVFEIPGRLVGLNDYVNANRTHAQKGAKMKREQEEIIMWAIKRAGLRPIKRPVLLDFFWIEPNMRRDKDNVAFAKKFILDALVKSGVLHGDNWNFVEGFTDSFRVNPDNPRIVVELRQL